MDGPAKPLSTDSKVHHRASNSIQFQLTINVTTVVLTPRTTSGSRRRAQGHQRRLHRRRLRRAGHHASNSTLNTALSLVMTEAETALHPLPPSTASPSWGRRVGALPHVLDRLQREAHIRLPRVGIQRGGPHARRDQPYLSKPKKPKSSFAIKAIRRNKKMSIRRAALSTGARRSPPPPPPPPPPPRLQLVD